MISVKVEFWLWMGEELDKDFHSPSDMRSTMDMNAQGGTTIMGLFAHLADRNGPIGEKIYNRGKRDFYPNLVVTLNDRVISPNEIHKRILEDGDKVTVLPMYMGGRLI